MLFQFSSRTFTSERLGYYALQKYLYTQTLRNFRQKGLTPPQRNCAKCGKNALTRGRLSRDSSTRLLRHLLPLRSLPVSNGPLKEQLSNCSAVPFIEHKPLLHCSRNTFSTGTIFKLFLAMSAKCRRNSRKNKSGLAILLNYWINALNVLNTSLH